MEGQKLENKQRPQGLYLDEKGKGQNRAKKIGQCLDKNLIIWFISELIVCLSVGINGTYMSAVAFVIR